MEPHLRGTEPQTYIDRPVAYNYIKGLANTVDPTGGEYTQCMGSHEVEPWLHSSWYRGKVETLDDIII